MCASAPAHADILIGQTTGITGTVADSVGEALVGVNAYINHVNAQGGVHGEAIKLITLDDNFKPPRAAENAARLIEQDKVVALFMSRGTPHTEAILPLLAKHKLALVAPSTGAMVFHQPVNPYVFNVRSSYQVESQAAIEHLYRITLQRVAVVYAEDSFGADCLEGAKTGYTKAGKEPVAVLKAAREKPDYGSIVQQIKAANAQAVLWCGSGLTVVDGVKALRQAGSAAQVVTLSNNASRGFIKLLGNSAHGIIVSQVFPSATALGVPLNREATAVLAGKAPLSPALIEGFAAAKVLVEGLRRAGPQPTREKVLAAFNGLGRYDLGGLELGYGPSDHTGLSYVELSIVDREGRFMR